MTEIKTKKTLYILACIIIVVCWIISPIKVNAAAEGVLPSGIDVDNLAEQIDEYVDEYSDTTAGMAYSVFSRSDEIATGYFGNANIDKEIPIDENTVFEWGSASKLMVWVSAMQLKEQGKLDLEEDIRLYLPEGFLKNLKFDTPITMIDLMNHAAGFQESYTDIFVDDIGGYTSLDKVLLAHEPAQIFEPGTVVAYSNWSTALAAYIVERVSETDYVEYVHKNIFEPLQMQHSAIAMDLSDNKWVKEKRAELTCYDNSGNLLPGNFFYITVYPAGACTSTLEDFRIFAQSLMDENTALFQNSETWNEFFSPTCMYDGTDIGRNYHGMWMIPLGVPTIGHGGNTYGCSSYLLMNLEYGIGTVVMTNQASESVYNIDMMKLIYGEYKDSKYDFEKGDPQGFFKEARTFKIGPLKLLNFGYAGDLDEENVFSVYSESNSLRKVEYPYTDYYGIGSSEMILEIAIVGGFLITFVLALVISLIRGVKYIVRKCRKVFLEDGTISSGIIFGVELVIVGLILFVIKCLSSYYVAVTYQWAIAVIGILGIILLIMTIVGLKSNVCTKRNKWYKAGNYIVISSGLFMIINILYWNLFMFWAL